jgi:hypothetical protein
MNSYFLGLFFVIVPQTSVLASGTGGGTIDRACAEDVWLGLGPFRLQGTAPIESWVNSASVRRKMGKSQERPVFILVYPFFLSSVPQALAAVQWGSYILEHFPECSETIEMN